MDAQPSFISIDTFHSDAFPAGALGLSLPMSDQKTAAHSAEAWTDDLARSLQAQHGRVREFLDRQRQRWQQAAANFQGQIESLEGDVHSLQATCDDLRSQLAARSDLSDGDDLRQLTARNAELERQLEDAAAMASPTRVVRAKSQAADGGANDWEAQKRRMLAALESDDRGDSNASARADAAQQRMAIDEIVRRTDKIIAEKDREIDELKQLLASQSTSMGVAARGAAAALEGVFDHDEIVRAERARLQQLQAESRDKLRKAEIEIAMERATLARREAELESRLLAAEVRRSAADAEGATLAPTGRPIRGRWRAQMGLSEE